MRLLAAMWRTAAAAATAPDECVVVYNAHHVSHRLCGQQGGRPRQHVAPLHEQEQPAVCGMTSGGGRDSSLLLRTVGRAIRSCHSCKLLHEAGAWVH